MTCLTLQKRRKVQQLISLQTLLAKNSQTTRLQLATFPKTAKIMICFKLAFVSKVALNPGLPDLQAGPQRGRAAHLHIQRNMSHGKHMGRSCRTD